MLKRKLLKKKEYDTDPGKASWFEPIAKEALDKLKKHHKWKDMELAAMGPGNKRNYMNMAIWNPKHPKGDTTEYEFKVHFDQNTEKVKKIEDVTPKWRTESVNEDHMDTISEPYMFKVGDVVHNDNPGCPHYGSKGIVITTDPEEVRYTVTNDGNFFKPGDILQKTVDQLKLA